ncbi:MAG: hypothetical protein DMF88_16605 [Acidobacteria bacterium]|nr:MAG: hypothetical protein DMF88_16605 [Acidobacteriota bacterium]
MISRRRFVGLGVRSVAALGGGIGMLDLGRLSAFAQTASDYRALVCVFLQGGNDANNMIVPLGPGTYDAYAAARGVLAVPSDSLLPVSTTAGQMYGLHPSLASLLPLFQQRRMAVAANVGMLVQPMSKASYAPNAEQLPRNLFSHMDQALAWQSAVARGNIRTGWGGRIVDQVPTTSSGFPTAVSVAGNALFATGATSEPATIIPGLSSDLAGVDTSAGATARVSAFEQLLDLPGGTVLIQAASATTREGLEHARLLTSVLAGRAPLTTTFPSTDLGVQLQEVAKVIQVRQQLGASRQIFFCSIGGFDTHVAQTVLQEPLLLQLADALAAFYRATMELGVDSQVTTFTASEFGRTLQPTFGAGTDHAWGSHHFVIGGAVRGGDIYGQFPTVALGGPDDISGRGVWLPTSSLDQYGATLASWFGVPPVALPIVFPNLSNFGMTSMGFIAV